MSLAQRFQQPVPGFVFSLQRDVEGIMNDSQTLSDMAQGHFDTILRNTRQALTTYWPIVHDFAHCVHGTAMIYQASLRDFPSSEVRALLKSVGLVFHGIAEEETQHKAHWVQTARRLGMSKLDYQPDGNPGVTKILANLRSPNAVVRLTEL